MGSRLIFRHPTQRLMAGDAEARGIGVIDAPVPQGRRHFDPEVPRTLGHEKPRPDDASARTAIRHRCARRASEGVRENPREGTRQNDPVPSVQGVLSAMRAAEDRLWRLFIKNTGLCQLARGRIESDACSVSVG